MKFFEWFRKKDDDGKDESSKAKHSAKSRTSERSKLGGELYSSSLVLAVVLGIVIVCASLIMRANPAAALLVALASGAVGAFFGFLFAIPRALSADVQPGDIKDPGRGAHRNSGRLSTRFAQNSNLEQISDWLTKIVVGVSLVELKTISGDVLRLSRMVSHAAEVSSDYALAFTAIMLAAGILGFMWIYIWTRTDFLFYLQFTQSDVDKLNENMVSDAFEKAFDFFDTAEVGRPARSLVDDAIWDSDPHKNKFGGLSKILGAELSAQIVELTASGTPVAIEATVTVDSSLEARKVTFYLHPTFNPSEKEVPIIKGRASFKFIATEAFTLGAKIDGKIPLELDLAELPNVSPAFIGK